MPTRPLFTAHLFPELDGQLVALLASLEPAEWRRPTIAPGWTVRDVAAHLLDTALRRLSIARDGWAPSVPPFATSADLITWVNATNARGVAVHGAQSPSVLLALTRAAIAELHTCLAGLDPFAPAVGPVSWAGETPSANWFDIARELTERWHHQAQIRLALDRPGRSSHGGAPLFGLRPHLPRGTVGDELERGLRLLPGSRPMDSVRAAARGKRMRRRCLADPAIRTSRDPYHRGARRQPLGLPVVA